MNWIFWLSVIAYGAFGRGYLTADRRFCNPPWYIEEAVMLIFVPIWPIVFLYRLGTKVSNRI